MPDESTRHARTHQRPQPRSPRATSEPAKPKRHWLRWHHLLVARRSWRLVGVGRVRRSCVARTTRPDAQRPRHGAGHDRLLDRRQDRARPPRRRDPAQRAARRRAARRAARGAGGRGPRPSTSTAASRRSASAAPSGTTSPAARRRAARRSPSSTRRTPSSPRSAPGPQDQGGAARLQARDGRLEGPDPRQLPQHHLLRSRRLRHRGGVDAYFGVPVSELDARAGRRARRHHQVAQRPGPRERNLDALEARWNYVLDGMVEKGWLTPEAARERRSSRRSRSRRPTTASAARPASC